MLNILLPVFGVILLLSNLATWHYTDKHAGKELARITATLNAERKERIREDAQRQRVATAARDALDDVLRGERAAAAVEKDRTDRLLADLRAHDIRLPGNVRRVFDSSVGAAGPPEVAGPPAAAAGEARPAEAAPPAEVDLSDLLATAAENNRAHLKCVEQVEGWQNFWLIVKQQVEAQNGRSDEGTGPIDLAQDLGRY